MHLGSVAFMEREFFVLTGLVRTRLRIWLWFRKLLLRKLSLDKRLLSHRRRSCAFVVERKLSALRLRSDLSASLRGNSRSRD